MFSYYDTNLATLELLLFNAKVWQQTLPLNYFETIEPATGFVVTYMYLCSKRPCRNTRRVFSSLWSSFTTSEMLHARQPNTSEAALAQSSSTNTWKQGTNLCKMSQWHGLYCHDLEVMSSNPSRVELGVHGTSVLSRTWTKNIFIWPS